MTGHGEPPRDSQGRPMRYNAELSERLTMALNTQADIEALPERDALLALHHPVPYTWTEWAPEAPEDDPGTDHTIQVCEECRRVEVSDAVHWSEAGEPNASRWPCRTAQLTGGTNG